MTKPARRSLNRESGAAAVEFALVAPLLFMLLFGIFEFGLVWSQKNVYVGAAREGARYAAVNCEGTIAGSCASGGDTWGKVKQRITDAAVGYPVNFSNFAVTSSSGAGCTQPGGTVKVSWTQPMTIDIPFLPVWNLNVPIEAVFRCE
jgi:Flp pilus assembly protein TadG